MMKQLCIYAIFVATLLLGQVALAQQGARTIFLVRDAQATGTDVNATLTPAGEQRAQCLARTLAETGIKQIFVSEAKRTQQTAAPLAAQLKLTPSTVAANDVSTLVRNLLYGTSGNVLVVGHSNTVPVIIQRLQAGNVAGMSEKEFDRMFVVTVIEGSGTPAATLRYCPDSAPLKAIKNMPAQPAAKKQ
jgi:broad specificity phosphatase PhoE